MTLRRQTGHVQRRHGKNLAAADVLGAGRNLLTNGCFRVAQRGTSFDSTTTPANSNDTYLLDRWLLLSDGNDIVDVSQETTTVPSDAYAAIALDVETANKEFGIVQILENRDIQHVVGDVVSLSFEARISSGGTSIGNLRAAVVSCDATADSVTSDMVSAWGGDGSANPTLISGAETWTFENTPANLTTPTTSYQRYTIENIPIDTAGTNNIAVFIWVNDVTTTAGHILYISKVQLEAGSIATPFERRPFGMELQKCQRHYTKTFDYDVAPIAGGSDSNGALRITAATNLANRVTYTWTFPETMFAVPSVTMYNPSGAADSDWEGLDGGADRSSSASEIGTSCVAILVVEAPADTQRYEIHATAEAEL